MLSAIRWRDDCCLIRNCCFCIGNSVGPSLASTVCLAFGKQDSRHREPVIAGVIAAWSVAAVSADRRASGRLPGGTAEVRCRRTGREAGVRKVPAPAALGSLQDGRADPPVPKRQLSHPVPVSGRHGRSTWNRRLRTTRRGGVDGERECIDEPRRPMVAAPRGDRPLSCAGSRFAADGSPSRRGAGRTRRPGRMTRAAFSVRHSPNLRRGTSSLDGSGAWRGPGCQLGLKSSHSLGSKDSH